MFIFDETKLEDLRTPEIREFVIRSLQTYGTEEKFNESVELNKILKKYLIYKRIANPNMYLTMHEVLVIAAFTYNLFYKEDDITTLFKARKELMPLVIECRVPHSFIEPLFQTIEGQLGDNTPMTNCIPKPTTPSEMFANCIWFMKNIK